MIIRKIIHITGEHKSLVKCPVAVQSISGVDVSNQSPLKKNKSSQIVQLQSLGVIYVEEILSWKPS